MPLLAYSQPVGVLPSYSLRIEGGDDLLNGCVLLGVELSFPPHDEVGGLRADRDQN